MWAPAGRAEPGVPGNDRPRFRTAGDTPPDTTPQQVYRQVREYHDRYPDKAIVAWNGGAGPIPVLMAGGAEALMRNPSGGHGQGKTVDRTPLDGFVREHLAGDLMKMQPQGRAGGRSAADLVPGGWAAGYGAGVFAGGGGDPAESGEAGISRDVVRSADGEDLGGGGGGDFGEADG